MTDPAAPYDLAIVRRGLRWEWQVVAFQSGKVLLYGLAADRAAARYAAYRAIFLLLSAIRVRPRQT